MILFVTISFAIALASCEEVTTNYSTETITTSSSIVSTTVSITTSNTTSLITTETTTLPETTTVTTYDSGAYIRIISPSKTTYNINEELDLDGLMVVFYPSNGGNQIINSADYTVNTVDMSTSGTKEVTINYNDYSATFIIEVLDSLSSYYVDATGLDGVELFLELRSIINTGFHGVTYGEARYILDETDADPNNSNNLILVYLGTSISGIWDYGASWNREHVFPQSALGVSASNELVNMASDLQNLKPASPSENSSRGNKYFSNINNSVSYEPRNEVKGDIARILLYMIVMYDQLSLVDSSPNISNQEMGLLYVLLQWHEQDPVDDFEMNRNNIIESYQGNRNPFIDYPEFVELIWD